MSTKIEKPTTVVMGLKDGKHHAVVYSPDLADKALAAAVHWGLLTGTAESKEALSLAKNIPNGSIFDHKKMEPPTITKETYDAISQVISLKTPPQGEAAKRVGNPAGKSKAPAKSQELLANPWNAITEGSTVLAHDRESGGYYAATVEKASADRSILTCSWANYPKLPHFTVRRLAVGLLAVVK